MTDPSLEQLFLRYQRDGDAGALTKVFDAAAGDVMQLAVYLAPDRSTAEDLVQATFLTAIESAGRYDATRPLMPWLLGILTNLAHRERARSRRHPDPRQLRSGTVDGPESVAEEQELASALTLAMDGIREPYREVLELHLRQGLEPTSIARALRRPPGTVRSQLYRGLDLVRRALPKSYVVAGTAFAASTWLRGPSAAAIRERVRNAAAVKVAPAATLLGALLVKKTLITVATVSALSAIAILAWNASQTARPVPGSSGDVAAADPAPLVAAAEAPELDDPTDPAAAGATTTPETEERTRLDSQATWVVQGKTLRGWKEAYPHVHVLLQIWPGYETTGEPIEEARVRSDASGSFRWVVEPPTGTVTVKVQGDEPEHSSYGESTLVVAGDPAPDSLSASLYPLDCTISGVVRDSEGRPIAAATVRTGVNRVETGRDGQFEVSSSSVRDQDYVYATAAGHAQQRAIAEIAGPGSTTVVNFALGPAFQVRGRVVDEDGRGVEGASVRSFFTNQNVATTDAAGRFVLDHLDPARDPHSIYARKDGYVEAQAIATPDTEELPDLVLTRGVRVQGHVIDDRGQPLPGARIHIGFSPSAYNRLDAVSRDDGSFAFPHVAPGSQTMRTIVEGFAPDTRTLTIAPGQVGATEVQVRLQKGHFIAGVTLDEGGKPMAGVHISPRYRGEYTDDRSQTDDRGRFRVEDLPGEHVELEFFGTGIVRQRVPVTSFDHEDLRVVIQAAGKVAGRVIDGVTGEPLSAFTIRFIRTSPRDGEPRMGGYAASWAREGHRFADSDGYWDSGSETLTPGAAIGIEVRADGYAPGRLDRLIAAGEPDPDAHVVAMHRGARISGRVVDHEGRPVPSAKIGLKAASDPSRRFSDEPYEHGVTHTDADGVFALEAASPGESVLVIEAPSRPQVVHGPFEVPTEGVLEKLIRLPGGARLLGTLRAGDGSPRDGETIQIYANEVDGIARFSESTTTDASGGFSFENLPDGLYQVSHQHRVDQETNNTLTIFAAIRDGQDTQVDLRPTGTATLVGSVRMADGTEIRPLLALQCHPRFDQNPSAEQREAAPPGRGAFVRDGVFEIDGIRAGDYQLVVSHFQNGVRLIGAAQITVRDGGRHEVEIELQEFTLGR